jgi:uncharacterized glyoxalase superfamily protein PhnB
MSNLENLRKQAKQVLRWHRERHWPIATQLRNTLPDFRDLSDRQVFERDFALADAQEFVARRAGFESWQALKAGADALPGPGPRPAGVLLLAVRPCLFVADIDAACDYYRSRLGFEIVFKYGEPPFYGELCRDGVQIALRHVDPEDRIPARERKRQEELLSAMIVVDNPKRLYQEFLAAGVAFHKALRTEPWGKQAFIVEDEDGNLVAFSEP